MNEIRYQQMEGKSPPRQVKVKYNNSQGHAAVESTVLLDPNTEMEAVGVWLGHRLNKSVAVWT